MEEIKPTKSEIVFLNQPIPCPWVTSQPYQSALRIINRPAAKNVNTCLTNTSVNNDSLNYISSNTPFQQSSSHFFYFLRLMQLFPDTHPATLHTVLTLTKNNFFYAIDKLLYAKKCKALYHRRQHPYNRPSKVGPTVFNKNTRYGIETLNCDVAKVTENERVVEISVEEDKLKQDFDSNQEVIEIVCFDDEAGSSKDQVECSYSLQGFDVENGDGFETEPKSDGINEVRKIEKLETEVEVVVENVTSVENQSLGVSDSLSLSSDDRFTFDNDFKSSPFAFSASGAVDTILSTSERFSNSSGRSHTEVLEEGL